MTRPRPAATKCANTDASPAASPSPVCATMRIPLLVASDKSSTSDAGQMIETSTSSSDFAKVSVSSRRQRYNSITAGRGRLCAKRVFTRPGRGALAMTTSAQSSLVEGVISAPEGSVEAAECLHRLRRADASPAKIVAHNAAENEPRRAKRAGHSAADL